MPTDPNRHQEAEETDPSSHQIRGVTKLKDRPERPSPYGVQWWASGVRKREFYKTERDRDARYSKLVEKARRGQLGSLASRDEREAWQAFCVATEGTPWQDVVAGWRRDLASQGKVPCTLTVAEAVKEFLPEVDKMTASAGYKTHVRQKIRLFGEAFGANKLDAVTGEEIGDWIENDLGFTAAGTFNMYRKMVRLLYERHRRMVRNPCDDLPARSEVVEKVETLSVKDTARLFSYALAHKKQTLGRLALEAFAGLRFSSAFRLDKSDINFADKGILLPAHKLKTRRRHYIDGLPDNLWLWLGKTNDECWAMSGSDWMHAKSAVFADAKVPHPRNCLRHSFCTYHVAAFKNPGLTATLLCHRNQQKLWANYNGLATQADGKRYFTITPDTVDALASS